MRTAVIRVNLNPAGDLPSDRLAAAVGELRSSGLEVIAPDGWHVQIDANTETTTPAHLHALPGVHSLAGQGPTGPVQHQDVTLEGGKVLHVELTPKPAMSTQAPTEGRELTPFDKEPAPAPPPPADHRFELRRVVAVGVAGVGVGSLVFGAVLGSNALGARDAYNAAPTREAYDHATSLATWTDVALIAGGVCVAGGVVLWFWPTPKGDGASAASRQRGPHQEPEATVSLVPTLNGDTTQWWKLATIISCGTLAGAVIPELVKVFTSTE